MIVVFSELWEFFGVMGGRMNFIVCVVVLIFVVLG